MKKDDNFDQKNIESKSINEGIEKTKEKTKGFINEFKQFALRGNVVDMAVGVIIGGAFGGIINSLVNDLVMPFIGMITSGQDYSKLTITFGDNGTINYGLFLQAVINFFVIAFAVFLMVKIMNSFIRKKEANAPTQLDVLLEIRDLLKEKENPEQEVVDEEGKSVSSDSTSI